MSRVFKWGGKAPCLLTMALAGIILFLRFPDELLHPQIFAEGGVIVFRGAYELGRSAILIPYGGYLILVPRLIAWLAQEFDPRWTPAIYNYCAFTIELLVLLLVFSPRVRLPAKPAIVLVVALVPHSGEVFNAFLNIQWWLALALILILVSDDADNGRRRLFDAAAVGACGLTGPFSVFFLPVFILRAWFRRSRESALLAGVTALVAAVQVRFMTDGWAIFDSSGAAARWNAINGHELKESLAAMGFRVFGTYWRGYGIGSGGLGFGWIALGIALAALGAFFGLKPGPFAFERRILAGVMACLLIPVWIKFARDYGALGTTNGDRYFFLPHVLIGWLLVLVFAAQKGWRRVIPAALLLFAIAANKPYFTQPPLPDLHWEAYLGPIRAGKPLLIPINPQPWMIDSPGRNSGIPP